MLKFLLCVGKGLWGKGLCSPEAPTTGPCQKRILGQMNPGFNPIWLFLRAFPQYKFSSQNSVFLEDFTLVCCRWAANMHRLSTADYPSLESGQWFKFLMRPHAAGNAGKLLSLYNGLLKKTWMKCRQPEQIQIVYGLHTMYLEKHGCIRYMWKPHEHAGFCI